MSKKNPTTSIQRDWLNDYEPELPAELPRALHSSVKEIVTRIRLNQNTSKQDLIKYLLPYVTAERAMDLASSELTRAAAAATNAQQRHMRSQGIAMVRVWSTNNDAHVCAMCQSFDKQSEDVWGTQFPKGPPVHEGCRCDITLRLDRTPAAKPKTITEQLATFVQRILGKR